MSKKNLLRSHIHVLDVCDVLVGGHASYLHLLAPLTNCGAMNNRWLVKS